jgi:hypothetical protein
MNAKERAPYRNSRSYAPPASAGPLEHQRKETTLQSSFQPDRNQDLPKEVPRHFGRSVASLVSEGLASATGCQSFSGM